MDTMPGESRHELTPGHREVTLVIPVADITLPMCEYPQWIFVDEYRTENEVIPCARPRW